MARSRAGRHPPRPSPARSWPELNPDAAGIDVGATAHGVAVPAERAADPVREVGPFTNELYRLAEWLRGGGVESVAMESTGVDWSRLCQVLAARGVEVKLVDARQLTPGPGRKRDVLACQWLQPLHTVGVLAGACRPDDQICVLRSDLRQRALLAQYAGQHVQPMQQALVQMKLPLQVVLDDSTGATGPRHGQGKPSEAVLS